jgi:DNA-binding transcriptional MerR regulator
VLVMANTGEVLRIGELSNRVGVSPELLRAWERRYGLLRPARSAGGLRLYSPADVERVTLMQQHLAEGMAAAEAAALAVRDRVDEEAARTALRPEAIRSELAGALDAFDEPRAQTLLDRLLAVTTVDTLLSEVVVPYLQELGERWERGEASVAQEHFASGVLRGRLLGLARGWGLGVGPAAVLACLPGEQHDLGLIAFGLALRSRGWRIVYLGPDSPIDTIADASRRIQPSLVVLNAVSRERVRPALPKLRELARHHRLALGGAAAADSTLERSGILTLTGDPTAEAARVSTPIPSGNETPKSEARPRRSPTGDPGTSGPLSRT